MPGVFLHAERQLLLGVHVDDVLVSGEEHSLLWLHDQLKKVYDVEYILVGPGYRPSEVFLGRTLRWTSAGLEWEANEKHVRTLLSDHNMTRAKPMATPITTDQVAGDEKDPSPLLAWGDAKRFRSSVARINYLAQDRPGLSLCARVLANRMARPRDEDMQHA